MCKFRQKANHGFENLNVYAHPLLAALEADAAECANGGLVLGRSYIEVDGISIVVQQRGASCKGSGKRASIQASRAETLLCAWCITCPGMQRGLGSQLPYITLGYTKLLKAGQSTSCNLPQTTAAPSGKYVLLHTTNKLTPA